MITEPLQLLRDCIEKGLNFEAFQKRSSELPDCTESSEACRLGCPKEACQREAIRRRIVATWQFASTE